MRISDWSSDVCSSDLFDGVHLLADTAAAAPAAPVVPALRLRFRGLAVRRHPVEGQHRNLLADQPFDPGQQLGVLRRGPGDGTPRHAGPAGAADPVDVVLGMARNGELENVAETLDVAAAARHEAADPPTGLHCLDPPTGLP